MENLSLNKMQYCPKCGQFLLHKEINLEGIIPYCANCDQLYFPHDAACIIAIIEYQNKLLLIKQEYLGDKYCLVAGHVKSGANLEITLKEEIKEEVGLDLLSYAYLGSFYHEKSTNLMVGFYAKCQGDVCINDEVNSYDLMNKNSATIALKDRSAGSYFLKLAIEKGLI